MIAKIKLSDEINDFGMTLFDDKCPVLKLRVCNGDVIELTIDNCENYKEVFDWLCEKWNMN